MRFRAPSKSKRKALWLSTCLALASTVMSAAQSGSPAITTDPVFKAMIDEMSRSISQLQLSSLDKPYFIQYIVLDEDEFAARATFGAITQSSPTKQRLIYSQVRVGNYDFDNTEFQAGGRAVRGVARGAVSRSR